MKIASKYTLIQPQFKVKTVQLAASSYPISGVLPEFDFISHNQRFEHR